MAATLLIQFDDHQEELALIGKMILAYGELEFAVMDIVRATMGGDTEKAVKVIYRLRSESNRLEVADALITPDMRGKSYGGYWHEVYCALKRCKTIRNQYAHGQFISDGGILRFGDLDEAATSKADKFQIRMRPIHLKTLKEQWLYFEYAHHIALWLSDQIRLEMKLPRVMEAKVPKPQKVSSPKLDSRGEEHPRQVSETAPQQPQ